MIRFQPDSSVEPLLRSAQTGNVAALGQLLESFRNYLTLHAQVNTRAAGSPRPASLTCSGMVGNAVPVNNASTVIPAPLEETTLDALPYEVQMRFGRWGNHAISARLATRLNCLALPASGTAVRRPGSSSLSGEFGGPGGHMEAID